MNVHILTHESKCNITLKSFKPLRLKFGIPTFFFSILKKKKINTRVNLGTLPY